MRRAESLFSGYWEGCNSKGVIEAREEEDTGKKRRQRLPLQKERGTDQLAWQGKGEKGDEQSLSLKGIGYLLKVTGQAGRFITGAQCLQFKDVQYGVRPVWSRGCVTPEGERGDILTHVWN